MKQERATGAAVLWPDVHPSPSLIVWDWMREVYPKQLVVKPLQEVEPLAPMPDIGGYVLQSNYDVVGCGRVHSRWYEDRGGVVTWGAVTAAVSQAVIQDTIDEWVLVSVRNENGGERAVPNMNAVEEELEAVLLAAVLSWYVRRQQMPGDHPRDPGIEVIIAGGLSVDARGLVRALPGRGFMSEFIPFRKVS